MCIRLVYCLTLKFAQVPANMHATNMYNIQNKVYYCKKM